MTKDIYAERTPIPSTGPVAVAEPPRAWHLARDLIARLIPGADADLLVAALLAEREAPSEGRTAETRYDGPSASAERELARVRAQLALGVSALTIQHALNNPLTALLAEAQLLQLEPLTPEQRHSLERIVDLTRRLGLISRRLGSVEFGGKIG